MFDPENTTHINRLTTAIEHARGKLQPFRQNRLMMLKQYVGSHYSPGGSDKPVPVNLLKTAALIYQRQLVPRNPSVMVATRHVNLKPIASDMEVWMNYRIEEMRLVETLRRAVLDALFCVGIVKVGRAVTGTIEWQGWTHDVGEPSCDIIDLDDYVVDMVATRQDQVEFEGHRYRMPLDMARESNYFDKSARDKLHASTLASHNERGDERVKSLVDLGSNPDEFEDMVECWEIHLPRPKLVLTLLADDDGSVSQTMLRVADRQTPDYGAFHKLGFADVPGSVIPSGTMTDLFDLHNLGNCLFRKLGRQAERQKTGLAVPGSATADGDRYVHFEDGQAFRADQPGAVQEVKTGGIDQANFMFFMQIKALFGEQGGNLGALGGLGPQSPTLGQDQMIQENSSKTVQEMSSRVIDFSRGILRSMGWYWWTDPFQTYEVERTLKGTEGMSRPVRYVAKIRTEDRKADFIDLNFDIDPYSMQADTPSTRVQAINTLLERILMPALPMMEQQGLTIAWESVLRKLAYYMNMPDLDELVRFSEPPSIDKGPYDEAPRSAPVTTRNYVRQGAPGRTQQGQEQVLMENLMGMMNKGQE